MISHQEQQLREEMVALGHSLFMRGFTSGGSGNISARLPDGGWLVTPTNSCLGTLSAATLSRLDSAGDLVSGDKPSKEVPMHLAMYEVRPDCGAVVHLHSPWLTALSCLADLDPTNCLPPLTPYFVMRVGKLPLIPYLAPGSIDIAMYVRELAVNHNALLLANHGPIASGKTLRQAVFNAEELEDTARLFFILRSASRRDLTADNIAELEQLFTR